MRKPVQATLVAVTVVLAVATAILFTRYKQTTVAYTDMKAANESSQARYTKTIDAIAEIQDSLSAISLGDHDVQMMSQNLQTEKKLTGPDSQDALDRIALLRSSILRNKTRIHELESSVKASGVKVNGLQKMIANLKQTVSDKEAMVADLSARVDSLQTQVTTLATTVQENQDTIRVKDASLEDRRREIATVYYIVGNKKTLATSGAIVAKGGVLGLGKTLTPAPAVNENLLTAVDTDQETVIHTDAPKARVLSAQPSASYEMVLVDGKMELHILNPAEFRKIKQLVNLTA